MSGDRPAILLVEDDPGIGRFVSRGLSGEGYELRWVQTANEGLYVATTESFVTLILDIGLPDGDGLKLCRALREKGVETPVLMLTARETLGDKLDGFAAGADDYLPKPFAFEELLARLNVLARRGKMLGERSLAAGALTLDIAARTASSGEATVELPKREFDMLACLIRARDKVVSRQTILDEVWGADTALTENTVDVYVGYLRRRLTELPGAPKIQTVRGVGFRLATA